MMHVLFVIDPLPDLKAYKDSSVAMMRALVARGHRLSFVLQGGLFIQAGQVFAHATPISLVPNADLHGHAWWHEESIAKDVALQEFSAVLMRKDPPFDMEYVYATHMLEYAEAQGARVEHHDVIVKPLDGMGGTGVFRLAPHETNLNAILEALTYDGTRTIMAQRYIPEIKLGDKRILLIGGEPVPFCLARIPLAGETRGNLAAGGRGVAQPLTERDWEIAREIAPQLVTRGLLLVGLDVIGEYVTEINVTSPTCFVEITEQTGFNVAEFFVLALERAVALPPPPKISVVV